MQISTFGSGLLRRFKNLTCKAQQVGHIGEKSGVTSSAFQHTGVFVLHFALNPAVAKRCVLFRSRNQKSSVSRRAEACSDQPKWLEDFATDPDCKVLARQDLKCLAEQNETRIGVFGASPGFGFERQLQARAKECGRCCGCPEKLSGARP